jgi:hypothetical protein
MDMRDWDDNDEDTDRVELDSHVGTCVAGKIQSPLSLTGHKVLVSSPEHEAMPDIPIGTVRMSLIRLNDNRFARLQQYPSGYIATDVAC